MSTEVKSALELENLKSLARNFKEDVKHLQDMLAKKASIHSHKLALLEEQVSNLESNSLNNKSIDIFQVVVLQNGML